jgi:hypothetical protein
MGKTVLFVVILFALIVLGSCWIVNKNKEMYVHACEKLNATAIHSGPNSYICVDKDGRIVGP